MTDEIVEVEVFIDFRDSTGKLVGVLRDEDRTLFIYDDTLKIDLSPLSHSSKPLSRTSKKPFKPDRSVQSAVEEKWKKENSEL